MTTLRWAAVVAAVPLSPCVLIPVVITVGPLPGPWVLLVPILGIWMTAIPGGLWDAMRFRRRRRLLARCASEPWFADHAWDPRGNRRTGVRRAMDLELWLTAGLVAALYVAAFASLGFRPPLGPVIAGVVGSFGTWILISVLRDMSRGAVDVALSRFPYHPGDAVELHVGAVPGGPTLEDCVLTLQRIEERCRSRWTWRPEVTPTYADQRVPPVNPGPDEYVVVTFDVPEGAGGTCLSAPAQSYWELVIDARVDGRQFYDRLLVPVYERPR